MTRPQAAWWRVLVGSKQMVYALAIILIFLGHTLYLSVVAEDAFITYRFARHLAAGYGLVWNIGEGPVEGYTNFLWLLLSALLLKAGLDVLLFTQLFGILASLVTLVYTYRFAQTILNLSAGHALLPCLFLAASGPFATWAASGMEMNLFGMFLLVGAYYFASWIRCASVRALLLGWLALFLATLTRPEGFMVFVLLAAYGGISLIGQGGRAWRQYGLALLGYLVPFLSYFFWRYNYFGFLLPNTFYAKTGGGLAQYLRGAKYSGLFAFLFLFPMVPLLFMLVWERGFEGIRSRLRFYAPGRSQTSQPTGRRLVEHVIELIEDHLRNQVGIYLCGGLSLVYTLYIVYAGGDYMAMYRFFVPLLPFIYLLFGLVTHGLLSSLTQPGHKRVLAAGLLMSVVALTLLQSTPIEQRLFHNPKFMHGTYQGIQIERWHVARYKVIADFFKTYQRNEHDTLALGPVGVIPYYTEMTIHSIHAIVDPYIAHKEMPKAKQIFSQGLAGHEKKDLAYVLSKRPTYIMFSTYLREAPEPYPDYLAEIDQIIRANYELKSVWLKDSMNDEAGYFTFLELKP